jgi:hypothetical protein
VTRQVIARQTAMTIGVVLVVGALLSFAFRGPGDAQAIWLSGTVAILVQLAAFGLSGVAGKANLMARLGAGALIRLFALVIYALIAVLVLNLPSVAALVSLATFFFFSTLIEPLLIKS